MERVVGTQGFQGVENTLRTERFSEMKHRIDFLED